MTRDLVNQNRPIFDHLHPGVYKVMVGLVAWFALAAWILFDRQHDIGLSLAMVTVLLVVAVLVPTALFMVWRKHQTPHDRHPDNTSFHDWRIGDFSVSGGKLLGMHAAIDMLLPLAAAAFGLTAIGVVFLICASAAS